MQLFRTGLRNHPGSGWLLSRTSEVRWGPVRASCISPGCFGSLDKTQKLLRVLEHFPRETWLLQRPVPTELLLNIDFFEKLEIFLVYNTFIQNAVNR